jgi:hypothetical protein
VSRGPYTVIPLERLSTHYERGDPVNASTLPEARRIVREHYELRGVIPDVIDGGGTSVQVFTNEEVSKWGIE